jgi:hypothetical protein
MKKSAGLLLVLAVIFGFPSINIHAQSGFEGTIIWNMAMQTMKPFDFTINIKGDKSEAEMNMGEYGTSQMWSDRSTGKLYMYLSSLKKGMIMDMNDIQSRKFDSLDITPTGHKETIAGYGAEEYLEKTPKGVTSIWFTHDLPKDIQTEVLNWLRSNPRQDTKQAQIIKSFIDRGLAPVRIETSTNGKKIMTMQFVKFERKSLPDALFVPPSNITFDPSPSDVGSGTK